MNEPEPADRGVRRQSGRILAEPWPAHGRSLKRLSIDIPAELHTRIKVSCASRGTKIAEEVRALLERNFKEG